MLQPYFIKNFRFQFEQSPPCTERPPIDARKLLQRRVPSQHRKPTANVDSETSVSGQFHQRTFVQRLHQVRVGHACRDDLQFPGKKGLVHL
jgi:hypothetical protein